MKPGAGFAELLAGARGVGGGVAGFARGELGWMPNARTSLFGFGEVAAATNAPPSWMAGIGARLTW